MNAPKQPDAPLENVRFVAIMLKAQAALRHIEGMQKAIWITFLINYAIFGMLLLFFNGFLYFYLLNPLIDSYFHSNDGSWAWLGRVIFWIAQLTLGGIFAVVAFRLSVAFMSLWHENLVLRVIQHFRSLPQEQFSMKIWLKTLGKTLHSNLKQLLWIVLFLLMGFLPGIGLVLVFLLGAYLMGKDTTQPYLTVLEEHNMPTDDVKKALRFPGFFSGISQMLLAFIPWVGWALVPLVMTYQVIGMAYVLEEQRASSVLR